MNKKYYIREEDLPAMMDNGYSKPVYVGGRGESFDSKELADSECEKLSIEAKITFVVEEIEE